MRNFLFFNFKIKLMLSLYLQQCSKLKQIDRGLEKPELSLVGNWQGEKKEEKERIKKEINSVQIGYSD